MSLLRTLRKLVLGETWALPIGVAVAMALAGLVRVIAGDGGWWRDAGGALLMAGLVVALVVALPRRD